MKLLRQHTNDINLMGMFFLISSDLSNLHPVFHTTMTRPFLWQQMWNCIFNAIFIVHYVCVPLLTLKLMLYFFGYLDGYGNIELKSWCSDFKYSPL
jgi:hypothetical protein